MNRVFEMRLAVGKHTNHITGKKQKAHQYYPFGVTYVIPEGRYCKNELIRLSHMVIDVTFNFEKHFSILTIDGGIPLHKFMTPIEPSFKYDFHRFVHRGIWFDFEVRLDK